MDSSALTLILIALLAIPASEGTHFSWEQCPSSAVHALQVRDFGFAPDPVRLDDYVALNLRSEVTRNVTYPLTLTMTIRKETFFGWEIGIPCFSMISGGLPIGSCEYDVCSSLEYLESRYGCPSEFTNNDLPCHCPFDAAAYDTASSEPIRLFLDTSGLPSIFRPFLGGKYRITAQVKDGENNEVMCVEYKMKMTN